MLKSTWSSIVNVTRQALGKTEGNLKQTLCSCGTCLPQRAIIAQQEIKLTDEWELLNNVHDHFNEIVYLKFRIDQLKEQLQSEDLQGISDSINALDSFYPVFCNSYDKAFVKAWDHFIKPLRR